MFFFTSGSPVTLASTPKRPSCRSQAPGCAGRSLCCRSSAGREGLKYLWAVERGIFEMADVLDGMGFPVPEHIYVTDKNLT